MAPLRIPRYGALTIWAAAQCITQGKTREISPDGRQRLLCGRPGGALFIRTITLAHSIFELAFLGPTFAIRSPATKPTPKTMGSDIAENGSKYPTLM